MPRLTVSFISGTFLALFVLCAGVSLAESPSHDPSSPVPEAVAPAIAPATPVADFDAYSDAVAKRINAVWHPPKEVSPALTEVVFTIGRSGQLLGSRITTSSQSSAHDAAALEAIRQAAPFMPLPTDYKADSIEMAFTFNVKKNAGNNLTTPVNP